MGSSRTVARARLTFRSKTVGINVVQFDDPRTTVNVFVDGVASESLNVDHKMTLAEAFIWYGTILKLKDQQQNEVH